MHITYRPLGGNLVGALPQPSVSKIEVQVFGGKSQYFAIGTSTTIPINASIYAFAARHG